MRTAVEILERVKQKSAWRFDLFAGKVEERRSDGILALDQNELLSLFIESRIVADQTLEGLLKDIRASIDDNTKAVLESTLAEGRQS